MRSFGICLFLLIWGGASYAANPPCADDDFQFSAMVPRSGERKVEKKGCVLRFLSFLGEGQKLEVDVCRPEMEIKKFSSIADQKPDILPAGSVNCPLPLFGADFSTHANSAEEYETSKEEIWRIFREVKRHYLRPGAEIKTIAQKQAAEKFECMENSLRSYLNECEPQNWERKAP